MACLQARHAGEAREFGGNRTVRRDGEAAHQPCAQRIGGAQHHGARGLAHGERADRSAVPRPGERGTHAPAAVDGGDGDAEQVE